MEQILGVPMSLMVTVADCAGSVALNTATLLVVVPRAVEKVVVALVTASEVFLKFAEVVRPKLQLLLDGALLHAQAIAALDNP